MARALAQRLKQPEFWRKTAFAALVLLALALPLSIALVNVALVLLTLAAISDGSWRRRRWKNPVSDAFVLYFAVGVFVSIFGYDFTNSVGDWHKDFHKIWASALLSAMLPAEKTRALSRALAAGFSIACLIGLGQTFWHFALGAGFYRAHAFVFPVVFGDMTALAALGGFAFWFSNEFKSERGRRALLGLIALVLSALLLSGTRGAVLGLIAGLAALLGAQGTPSRKLLELRKAPPELIAAAAVLLVLVLSFFLREESLTAAAGAGVSSVSVHKELWIVGLKIFRAHPILGVGPVNYREVFPLYHKGPLGGLATWSVAHDMYIEAAAERGLFGFSALLLVLGALLISSWLKARETRSPISLWAFSAVAAFLVMNLTETAFQNEQTMTLLLFIWALGQKSQAS